MPPHHARVAHRPIVRESVAPPAGPKAVISLRAVNRLKLGHVWVYRSDVLSSASATPGAVVAVTDERGRLFGSALYSSSSQIALRMISSGPVADFPALLRERVRKALAYREKLVRDVLFLLPDTARELVQVAAISGKESSSSADSRLDGIPQLSVHSWAQ